MWPEMKNLEATGALPVWPDPCPATRGNLADRNFPPGRVFCSYPNGGACRSSGFERPARNIWAASIADVRENRIMSTSAERLVALHATVEQRFYRRTVPSALIYIAFGENNVGMLLNVSENGLLVSTPLGLTRNFVYRVSLRLNGLPRAIEVRVRIVWTTESKQRAGIQLLDLGEYDREQIRKWAALQDSREMDSELPAPQENIKASQEPTKPPLAVAKPSKRSGPVAASMSLPPPVLPRTNASSARSTVLTCAAVIAATCSAIALFPENGPLHKWLSHSASVGKENPTAIANRRNTSGKRTQEGETPALPELLEPGSGAPAAAGTAGSTASPVDTAVWKGLEGKIAVNKTRSSSKRFGAINPSANLDPSGPDATLPTESSTTSNVPATGDVATENPSDQPSSGNPAIADPLLNPPSPTDLSANSPPVSAPIPVASSTLATYAPAGRASHQEGAPDPAVIHMDVPESRVVEVTLPEGNSSSILSLPGERVLQSPSITLRIQRSIFMPPERQRRPSGRSRKVLLGEMLSRVDPQTPHFQVPTGSSVSVRAVLDRNGRVENLKPVTGSITLVPSVVRAVREWRYEPTLLDGQLVRTELNVLVQFHPPMDSTPRP
jgi:hypothetical protein